jgi:chromosome segregation ATPase
MQAALLTAIPFLQKTKILEYGVDKLLSTDHISKALAKERQKIFQDQEKCKAAKKEAESNLLKMGKQKEENKQILEVQEAKKKKSLEEKKLIQEKETSLMNEKEKLNVKLKELNEKTLKSQVAIIHKEIEIEQLKVQKKGLVQQKENIQKFLDQIESKKENQLIELEKIRSAIFSLEKNLSNSESELSFIEVELGILENKRNEILFGIQNKEQELKEYQIQIQEIRENIFKLNSEKVKIEASNKILQKLIGQMRVQIDNLRRQMNSIKDYNETHKVLWIEKKINISRENERGALDSRIRELELKMEDYQQQVNENIRNTYEIERSSNKEKYLIESALENVRSSTSELKEFNQELKTNGKEILLKNKDLKNLTIQIHGQSIQMNLLQEEKTYFNQSVESLKIQRDSIQLNQFDDEILKVDALKTQMTDVKNMIEKKAMETENLFVETENNFLSTEKEIEKLNTKIIGEEKLVAESQNEVYYCNEMEEFYTKDITMYETLINFQTNANEQIQKENESLSSLVPNWVKPLLMNEVPKLGMKLLDEKILLGKVKEYETKEENSNQNTQENKEETQNFV